MGPQSLCHSALRPTTWRSFYKPAVSWELLAMFVASLKATHVSSNGFLWSEKLNTTGIGDGWLLTQFGWLLVLARSCDASRGCRLWPLRIKPIRPDQPFVVSGDWSIAGNQSSVTFNRWYGRPKSRSSDNVNTISLGCRNWNSQSSGCGTITAHIGPHSSIPYS